MKRRMTAKQVKFLHSAKKQTTPANRRGTRPIMARRGMQGGTRGGGY